ncbi:hypothetical protein [Paenibacillus hamazuiensis]|uniref:hypothetical protein n=1 Tax=Paenibacillus hamazuiensis TaxID=2936508 RepID=UPI00200ED135|nr:hypothetical protein [Paenibacillus hamazuiensis]
MWPITGILAVSALIAFMEVPAMRRKNMKKELWVFFALLLLGTGLSIAQVMRVRIPNPLDWIAYIFKPMNDAIFSILK